MTGSRLLRHLLLCSLLAFVGSPFASSAETPVVLTPAIVLAGSPELISVHAPEAAAVDGEWLGRKIQFFRAHPGSGWLALAGADVEAPAGPSRLQITVHAGSNMVDLSRTIDIHPAHYRTGTLSVAPQFVEPG